MTKLTLSVNPHIIVRAKRYAATRGVSVSHLVQTMLDLVSTSQKGPGKSDVPPVLARLRGSLKRGAVRDYHQDPGTEGPVTRILLDVNVILDVLLDRRPHAESSSQVWSAIEEGRAEGLLSAHSVTTLHYLNARVVGASLARQTTESLLSVFNVAAVDEAVLRSAVALGWADFEDAVTAAAARRARCEAIVTRNPRDYKQSPVRVISPAEAAAWLRVAA